MNAANPADSPYVRPRLGWSVAALLAVLWLGEVALGVPLSDLGGWAVVTTPTGWCWLGAVWGTLAAGVAICAGGTAMRLGGLMAVVAWHVLLMHEAREEPATRYIILMGGYALVHAAALRLCALPPWQVTAREPTHAVPPRQFSILGLMTLTTAAAAVCAAAARYSVDRFDAIGTPLAVAILVLVALLSTEVVLARRRRLASLALLGGTLVVAPTALGVLHQWMTAGSRAVALETGGTYAVVITVFAGIVAGVHGAGRIDALHENATR